MKSKTKKQRGIYFLTFIVCVACMSLLGAALGTDYWVVSNPRREVEQVGVVEVNDMDTSYGERFRGTLHLGLFSGHKVFDSGFGTAGRAQDLNVVRLYVDTGLFNYSLWITTVIFACIAVLWGLVAAIFALINATSNPIETITGPMGLYLWNGIACLVSLLSVIMFIALFYKDINKSALTIADRQNLWTSKDLTHVGVSFWMIVAATIGFAVNVCLVAVSGIQVKPMSQTTAVNEKSMDTVIMY
ncbi:PREDICTED: clarin-3-like [Priapulus caudatus]|uniref:Clarin-3-like n=1 Tax=Priapulus caudatus TaxID=37621 RepID=A0ABM1ESE8_PRICU|nr:PREDICTED: clarin-3-like [Priapulus caudatus]